MSLPSEQLWIHREQERLTFCAGYHMFDSMKSVYAIHSLCLDVLRLVCTEEHAEERARTR